MRNNSIRQKINSEVSAASQIKVKGDVRCVFCGSTHELEMPKYAMQSSFKCDVCEHDTRVSGDGCCIFCEFGNTPCPPQQRRSLYFKQKNQQQLK